MVKFKLKANDYGQIYLPKEVREELGRNLELVGNTKTAVVFSAGLKAIDVLKSLKVLMLDLQHRAELEKNVTKGRDCQNSQPDRLSFLSEKEKKVRGISPGGK